MHRNWPENHDKYLSVVTIQFRPKRSRSRFEWEDVTFVPSRSDFKCETSCLTSGWRELTSRITNFVNVKYKTEKSLQPRIRISDVDQCHIENTNLSDLMWPWELGLVIAFIVNEVVVKNIECYDIERAVKLNVSQVIWLIDMSLICLEFISDSLW